MTNERDSLIERYFQTWLQYLAAGRGEFEELRRDAFEAGWTAKETHAVISTPAEPAEQLYTVYEADLHEMLPGEPWPALSDNWTVVRAAKKSGGGQ